MLPYFHFRDFSKRQPIKLLLPIPNDKKVTVTIGNCSYVGASNFEFPTEFCHILIGRFSSIANDINFLVGRNHDYRFTSTFPFYADDFVAQVSVPPHVNTSSRKITALIEDKL